MKATKNHISLETAELLKGCGVDSEYVYAPQNSNYSFNYEIISKKELENIIFRQDINDYSAYTWQEILWEYEDVFFSKEEYEFSPMSPGDTCDEDLRPDSIQAPEKILSLLQQEEYEKADKHFVEHCVLINKLWEIQI